MLIRPIEDHEYEELRQVWCDTFGDDPVFVDELYYALNAHGLTFEDEGVLHSFLTLFQAGTFQGKPVLVSYGICTKPESRGKGYGGELVDAIRQKVNEAGAISVVCPAEASLVEFYMQHGYQIGYYAKNDDAEAEELDVPIELQVSMLSASEYNRFREAFLLEIPHVTYDEEFLEFIRRDSVNGQGLLLINDGDAICALNYGTDEEMGISELIVNPALAEVTSEIGGQIAAGLAKMFDVEKCYFRSPTCIVYTDESGDHLSNGSYVQTMVSGIDIDIDEAAMLPYYGFPID